MTPPDPFVLAVLATAPSTVRKALRAGAPRYARATLHALMQDAGSARTARRALLHLQASGIPHQPSGPSLAQALRALIDQGRGTSRELTLTHADPTTIEARVQHLAPLLADGGGSLDYHLTYRDLRYLGPHVRSRWDAELLRPDPTTPQE